jgi:hypothetical protein
MRCPQVEYLYVVDTISDNDSIRARVEGLNKAAQMARAPKARWA